MHNQISKSDSEFISFVIDGKSGRKMTPQNYFDQSSGVVKKKQSVHFIKGPIPTTWIAKAIELGLPCCVTVALALCYQRGFTNSDQFKIEPCKFRELNVNDKARHRGLKALEEAGLIELKKNAGQTPTVTLIGWSKT